MAKEEGRKMEKEEDGRGPGGGGDDGHGVSKGRRGTKQSW